MAYLTTISCWSRAVGARLLAGGAAAGLLAGNLVWGAAGVSAQGPAACAPVASGLTAPRFVAVADDGTVYVSEAGSGGPETLTLPEEGGPPAGPDQPPPTRGTTGQVTRIAPGGARSVFASGLPSYAMGPAEVTGPAGIAVAGGSIWLAVGGAGPGSAVLTALPNENAVLRINPQTGASTRVADIGAYERANNPDGLGVDSNLYGLAMGTDGFLYVADAGGNSLYRVSQNGGQTLVTVFPGLPLPPGFPAPPGGNPERGGRAELDPVPTGVAPDPAGGVFVGNLSGGPFPQGAAKVLRVTPSGQRTDVAGDLTAVVGVAVGPDRQLYVSEIFSQFDLSTLPPTPRPGRVRRILADGRSEVVVDGLATPNGIAFDRAGNLYVVVNTAFTPPGPQGQLLRCAGVTAAGPGLPRTGNPGAAEPAAGAGGSLSGGYLPAAGLAALAAGGAAFFLSRRRAPTPLPPSRSSR